MALNSREVLESRDVLAEHKWKNWIGSDGVNETAVKFQRYVAGINETQLDMILEYLRRWCSTNNQNVMTVTGSLVPDVNGSYYDTGRVLNGSSILQRSDGLYEFRLALSSESGAYYWQLVRVSDDKVLWISSGGSVDLEEIGDDFEISDYWAISDAGVIVPVAISDDAASLSSVIWTANLEEVAISDMEISDSFDITDEGVIEPVTGALVVASNLPDSGILYRSVTDPLTNNGKVRSGIWRNGGIEHLRDYDGRYGAQGSWVVVQTLELELNISAPYGEDDTRWRQLGVEGSKSGSRNLVLELPYCDPSKVYDMADGLNADGNVFNSSIYTVNGGLLAGKWYHVDFDVAIGADGYGKIRWFLRNHDNEDFRFVYQANPGETHIHFFKQNMPVDGIDDFLENYYFDPSGNFYVSSDGTDYTAKNGETASGTVPADAKLLTASVDGREVSGYEPRPDEKTGEIDLRVRIVYSVGVTYDGGDDGAGGRHPIITFGEPEELVIFKAKYVGDTLPSNEQVVGEAKTIAANTFGTHGALTGRRKTVTRIQNANIAGGKFNYDVYETQYTAPIADNDEWFYQGSAALVERERINIYNAVVDAAGNAGWQPVDTSPEIASIILAVKRPKTVSRYRKYFTDRPTAADLTAAGLSLPETPNSDPTDITTYDVKQIGAHLFALEKVRVILGTQVQDGDNVPDMTQAIYQGSGTIAQTAPWPPE